MLISWWQNFICQSQTLHAIDFNSLSSEPGLPNNSGGTGGAASYVLSQHLASNQTLEKGGKEELLKGR